MKAETLLACVDAGVVIGEQGYAEDASIKRLEERGGSPWSFRHAPTGRSNTRVTGRCIISNVL